MTLFLGFAGPKTVLMVVARELLAGPVNHAFGAKPVRLGFSAGSSLRTFGLGRKEKFGVATTVG